MFSRKHRENLHRYFSEQNEKRYAQIHFRGLLNSRQRAYCLLIIHSLGQNQLTRK